MKYKQEMMEDLENPVDILLLIKNNIKFYFHPHNKSTISPAIFALINNLYETLEILKDHGANIFIPGKVSEKKANK